MNLFWAINSPLTDHVLGTTCHFACFCKVLFFLGSVFDIHFLCELLFLLARRVLLFLCWFFVYFSFLFVFVPSWTCLENFLHVRSCFLARSLRLRVWVDDVFVFLSPLGFFVFLQRERSGLTGHHTPPPALLFGFFLSPPHLSIRLFWPCVPSVLAFFSGCHSGPRAFFGFSRDFSEAFFLGREAAKAVARFLSVVFVFPFCGVCGYTHF